MTLPQSIFRVACVTALLLLIPLAAMQFTQEVSWTLADFVVAGALLFGTGLTYVLAARQGRTGTYRVAVGVAVVAGLLLVWANLAVGLIGSEHNPANLLYGGVLMVGVGGALAARFRPLGMSWAMFAAALTYVVVTAVALVIWQPSATTAEPGVGLATVLGANAAFAALWVVAGGLFRRAGTSSPTPDSRLA